MPAELKETDRLVETMKRAAALLLDAGIPFLLGGGLALFARGGPQSDHDVDFLVRPEDAESAQLALAEGGLRIERPPEQWLLKAYDRDVLVDLIFEPAGGPVTNEWLERGEQLEVGAMRVPVASLEDVMATKLLALSEQEPDFGPVLETARALREQVDWENLRRRTEHSAFAKAFFTLIEELGILPAPA